MIVTFGFVFPEANIGRLLGSLCCNHAPRHPSEFKWRICIYGAGPRQATHSPGPLPSLGTLGPPHPERLSDEPEVTQPSRAGPGPNPTPPPPSPPLPRLGYSFINQDITYLSSLALCRGSLVILSEPSPPPGIYNSEKCGL